MDDLTAEVVRGRVGDVSVAYLAQELGAAIGVEPVGVYIMPEIGYYPDSMFAALTLLSRITDAGEVREFFKSVSENRLRAGSLSTASQSPNHHVNHSGMY